MTCVPSDDEPVLDGGAQARQVLDREQVQAVGLGEARRRRARAASRRASRSGRSAPATGRKSKIPPPPLSISTIVSGTPMRRRGQQRPGVVGERTSPIRSTTGRGSPRRRRRRSRSSRRCRWRRGWRARAAASPRAGRTVSTSRTGIDEATTSVASGGRPRAELQRDPRLAELVAEQRRRCRAPRAASASRQARRPRRRRPAPWRPAASASSSAAGSASTVRSQTCAGSCQAPSGSTRTWTASSPPSHSRSGLDVGRSPTRSTARGRGRGGERRDAQQRVVVRDRAVAAARAGQRVGEHAASRWRR